MEHRPLGPLRVSALALGSWRTYERIPRSEGVAVLDAARSLGIDFLEVARYDDETGRAPIPTGYSEVVFGEIFRASRWPRSEVTIATKLWRRRRGCGRGRPGWRRPRRRWRSRSRCARPV